MVKANAAAAAAAAAAIASGPGIYSAVYSGVSLTDMRPMKHLFQS